jgi:hypothetical protein
LGVQALTDVVVTDALAPCLCTHPCRFKEAFLLDCDVILRRDPAFMFDAPLFRERGNYFWGDIYGVGMVKDEVFAYVGEQKRLAGQACADLLTCAACRTGCPAAVMA